MPNDVGPVHVEKDNTKEILGALEDAILAGLSEIGEDIEGIASDDAPYDTGRLAGSITHAVDTMEKAVYVGTNVPYAAYQELGTSRYKGANDGRGYLRPAVNDNRDRIKAIMRRHLESV